MRVESASNSDIHDEHKFPRDEDIQSFSLGEKLHREVQPENWCVTREDLENLEVEICQALEKALLRPSDRDAFDPNDREVGPNMYTVVEHYIKPVTASRGGMSWALMKHPEGLKCDIFVTHAWHEGVFELIDKVLASWPSGKKHAYICALSNPQNLDVGELISSPRESPFAKALLSCSHILVVPNRKVSIYKRLWCVYEAFLGYSLEKVILMARRPWNRKIKWSILELLPAFLIGLVCSLFTPLAVSQHQLLSCGMNALCFCIILLDATQLKRVLNHLAIGATSFTAYHRIPFCSEHFKNDIYPVIVICWGYYICMIVTCIFGAIDVLAREEAEFESRELTQEFSGDARDAQCSMLDDSKRILDEIGGRIDDVNHTIDVLLHAGMSTAELRFLASKGVRIEHGGYINLCLTSAGFFAWSRLALGWHYKHYDENFEHARASKRQLLMIFSCIGWSVLWITSERDRRAFASAAVGRIFYFAELLHYCTGVAKYGYNYLTWIKKHEDFHGIYIAVVGLITLFISVVGPARLIQVPYIGTLIVRYLMTKRLYKCFGHLFSRRKESKSSQAVELMALNVSSSIATSEQDYHVEGSDVVYL